MRTIFYILRKEFRQIFRNKVMLPLIFVMPVIQLILLVHAATYDMKEINTFIVDQDLSTLSRGIVSKISGSPFYKIKGYSESIQSSDEMLLSGNVDMVLVIPHHFEKKFYNNQGPEIQLKIDAVNSSSASLIYSYTNAIILDYNNQILTQMMGRSKGLPLYNATIKPRFWYNETLNHHIYMTPAVLVILVTVIGMFLTAINIIREKEMGTLEQINVTPIKKYQFIIGKLVPFWIIALLELSFGILAGVIIFRMPIVGNLFDLYVFASVYLIVALGMGLFLSTLADSQQQVMFIMFFFMITFILMSGIFTPVESMPGWAQKVNIINPFAYFIKVIRMILLKGSDLKDVLRETLSLLIYGVVILSLAVWRYRKVA